MFKRRMFLLNPIYLAAAMVWLVVSLSACSPTESSTVTADKPTDNMSELPADQDSGGTDEDTNSAINEERVEEEIEPISEEENASVDEPAEPESTMTEIVPEDSINFQTVAQGDSLIAEVITPTILVAGNTKEASQFGNLFDDAEVSRQIEGIDFDTKWAVLVFSGAAASSGYGISIEAVEPVDGEVKVHVQQSEPDPDLMVSAVISYPYHLIEIDKSNFQAYSANFWKMYDREGNLLAEITYP